MDRLIKTAWRAFWVGLGASAVLVSQSVLSPSPSPSAPPVDSAAPLEAPARPQLSPAAQRRQHADPVLSTLPRCASLANGTRCS
jgi:hypothetical protein